MNSFYLHVSYTLMKPDSSNLAIQYQTEKKNYY